MIEKRIGEELEMSDKIETFEAIVEAVEKQIPYKPTQWSNGAWKCKCGKLHVCHDWAYCPNCGQRVDLR